MNAEKCKSCKYRKVFFVGTYENPKFSAETCHWAWKHCEDVKPIECHYTAKENCHEQSQNI